jgi:hypothetical protein
VRINARYTRALGQRRSRHTRGREQSRAVVRWDRSIRVHMRCTPLHAARQAASQFAGQVAWGPGWWAAWRQYSSPAKARKQDDRTLPVHRTHIVFPTEQRHIMFSVIHEVYLRSRGVCPWVVAFA